MSESIYYTSNSHATTYQDNNRSSFRTNINQSYLTHMKGGNLYAAIESVTFDNSFGTVIKKSKEAHMIVIQLNVNKNELLEEYIGGNAYATNTDDDMIPNLESGNDYLFYNFDPPTEQIINPAIGIHSHVGRGFTDVKIYIDSMIRSSAEQPLHFIKNPDKCHVVHNIFLHPTGFRTSKDFVGFLNNTYHKISFDPVRSELSRTLVRDILYATDDGKCLLYNTAMDNVKIYLHFSVGRVLGFTQNQVANVNREKRSLSTLMLGIKQRDENNSKEVSEENIPKENEIIVLDDDNSILGSKIKKSDMKNINTYFEYERFGGYEPPKTFGQIHYTAEDFINNLLFDTDGINILVHSRTPSYIKRISSEQGSYEYYYIDKFSEFEYVLTEKRTDTNTFKSQMLALRASYSISDICNTEYDTLVAFINTVDMNNGVVCQEYKAPTYYLTTIEKLCSPTFNLIDVQTGNLPEFSPGSPTYIHVKLRREKRMHKQFNAFLDSSDKESLKYFPNNTNTDFRIRLPQRLEFNRNWRVCLKSIFIGNDLFNIFSEYCFIECKKSANGKAVQNYLIRLESGRYETIEILLERLNTLFEHNLLPIVSNYINGRVMLECSQECLIESESLVLSISPYLSMILGLSRNPDSIQNFQFIPSKTFYGTYEIDLELLTPQNYMILSDIVQSSVFGKGKLNILKMLSSKYNKETKIINFDTYIDEFIPLSTHDFSMLRIRITDTTGNILMTTGQYPTRVNLQFSVK